MTKQTYVRVGGVWKPCTSIWTKAGGVWKQDVMPTVRVGGVYKECMSYSNLIGISRIAYGRLYTWVAVNSQLLPSEWSVPTEAQVTSFLSYINNIRGTVSQRDFVLHRRSANTSAFFYTTDHPRWNNALGHDVVSFGAFGNGERYATGGFENVGANGYFWTRTEVSSTEARRFRISSFTTSISFLSRLKTHRQSLRFIRALTGTESSLSDGTHCGQIQDYNLNIYDTVKIGDFVWTVQNFHGTHTMQGVSVYSQTHGLASFTSDEQSIWNPAHEHYEFKF